MMTARSVRRGTLMCVAAVVFVSTSAVPHGQGQASPRAASGSPRDLAPLDLTGYWVSVVTEDWRYRMVTPIQGDYGSVPLNSEGRRVADTWRPAQAGACEGYGAAAVMRAPGRLHITWEDDRTLRIDTDAGQQTRRLRLGGATAPAVPPSWQGTSVASWDGPPDVIDVLRTGGFDNLSRGSGAAARRMAWTPLKVVTTNLRAGWLRTNGVPYSAQAVVTEHFMRFAVPDDGEWLTVRTVVDDPTYLVQPFMTSTNFKREADGSKWNPKACRE
ncbi:MAG TPA: hypothetical protein VIY56_17965 [Vicinamibacterales bacterium]